MQQDPPRALIDSALATSFVAYRVGRALQAAFPDLHMIEGSAESFDLDGFSDAGHCERTPVPWLHRELHTRWNAPFLRDDDERSWHRPFHAERALKPGDGSVTRRTANGLYEVRWQQQTLYVALASWSEAHCNKFHGWVLASEPGVADAFFVAVSRFTQAPKNEVLVINGEWWRKDADLFDRKYHFGLPTAAERDTFLRRWSDRIDPPMRPSQEKRAVLVAETEGFSFAYIKELCLAAMLRWLKLRPETGLYPIGVN